MWHYIVQVLSQKKCFEIEVSVRQCGSLKNISMFTNFWHSFPQEVALIHLPFSVIWTQWLTSSLIKYTRYDQMTLPVLAYERTMVSALDVCMCFLSSCILEEDSYHVRKWPRGEGSQLSCLEDTQVPMGRPKWQEIKACQQPYKWSRKWILQPQLSIK